MPVFSTSSVTTSKQSKPTLPDIEHIATRGHDPDDFSDLWPLDEQPLTYLPDIIAWRPPSQIFPCGCDSESDVSLDDEWIERQLDMITGELRFKIWSLERLETEALVYVALYGVRA